LLDLRPLLALDPAFDANDFLPGLLPPDSEPLWAVPTGAAYYLTFFDKSAFDAAGLPYPELDWTAEEFLTAAQTLTLRENDNVTQWGYVPGQMRYPTLLAARLTGPLDSGDSLRLTDPDVATAVQWVSDLFTLHQVAPWLDEYRPLNRRAGEGQPTGMALVNSGMAAMWHTTHLLYDENDSNVGVTAVPRGPYGYAADPLIYAFAASRGTANPEAAWKLLDFLSRQPPQDTVFTINPVPARQSVAAVANYWPQLPDSLLPALQYAAENNVASRVPFAAANLLQEALTLHIDDNVPIATALDQNSSTIVIPPEEDTPVIVAAPPDESLAASIQFATAWGLYEAHQELAKAFNETQADFQVTVQRIDSGNNFYTEIAGADCFLASAHQHTGIETKARSLNALFDLDPDLNPNDFYSPAIAALTFQGELLGLPGQIYIPLLSYNRNLFAAAGIDEPSPDWTLAEFLEIAQALTDPTIDQYGFIDWAQHSSLDNGLVQFGVFPVAASDGVTTIDFTAMAPAVRWYADLTRVYNVHPVLPGDLVPWQDYFTRDDVFAELVGNEQVAMWPGGDDLRDRFSRLEIGLVTWPRGPSGYSFSLADRLTAYFIAVNTQYPQFCWQWLKFLTTQPESAPANSSSLPAHIATAESSIFADYVGAGRAALLLAAVDGASHQRTFLGYYESWINPASVWLSSAMSRAAKGEADVDSALTEINDKFARYRECVIEKQAFDQYAIWRECAVEVDPDLRRRYD
jgi:ABC-type glycerol-3-phosphate transport system substrate-binding protein